MSVFDEVIAATVAEAPKALGLGGTLLSWGSTAATALIPGVGWLSTAWALRKEIALTLALLGCAGACGYAYLKGEAAANARTAQRDAMQAQTDAMLAQAEAERQRDAADGISKAAQDRETVAEAAASTAQGDVDAYRAALAKAQDATAAAVAAANAKRPASAPPVVVSGGCSLSDDDLRRMRWPGTGGGKAQPGH